MCGSEPRGKKSPPYAGRVLVLALTAFPSHPLQPLTAKRKLAAPLPPTVCPGHPRRRRPSAPSGGIFTALGVAVVRSLYTPSESAFAPSSPPTHFGRNTLARKPCSTSAVSFLHSLVATLTKICTRGRSTRARARASTQPPRPPTVGLLAISHPTRRLDPAPKRNPFSGLACSTGKLLHTS